MYGANTEFNPLIKITLWNILFQNIHDKSLTNLEGKYMYVKWQP